MRSNGPIAVHRDPETIFAGNHFGLGGKAVSLEEEGGVPEDAATSAM